MMKFAGLFSWCEYVHFFPSVKLVVAHEEDPCLLECSSGSLWLRPWVWEWREAWVSWRHCSLPAGDFGLLSLINVTAFTRCSVFTWQTGELTSARKGKVSRRIMVMVMLRVMMTLMLLMWWEQSQRSLEVTKKKIYTFENRPRLIRRVGVQYKREINKRAGWECDNSEVKPWGWCVALWWK